MIAWLVGIITFILALFVFWRVRSATFRDRCEEPKFRFLEHLGIPSPKEDSTKEKKNPQGESQ